MKPWYRAYVGTTGDEKIAEAALVAGAPRCLIIAVWHAILESASYEEADGAFSTTPRRIAATLLEPIAAIEAAFAGILEVGMISGGGEAERRVVKWRERQFASDAPGSSTTRVQALRDRRRGGGRDGADAAPEPPGMAGRPEPEPRASPPDGGGDDVTTCNAGPALHPPDVTLSESETESETDSSSVVVPFAPRGGPPRSGDDDDEILIGKISKALAGRAEARTVRAGMPVVAGWLASGCDLERDVLPELAEIGRKLTRPLATFAAPWMAAQVAARRDGRLAAQKGREGVAGAAGAPDSVFVVVGTAQWAAHVAAGHRSGLRATQTVAGRRREGWHFASEWPPPRESSMAPANEQKSLAIKPL